MLEIKVYDDAEDAMFLFAVIIARHKGKWVFCKHKDRDTLEVPGGHWEPGEEISDTARRELYEETGAVDYTLSPVCTYSVTDKGVETFGKLFYAEIKRFEEELHSEIEKIFILDELPSNWTYPLIQPRLIDIARARGYIL
jgi:8-oxo-dGTP diphosphatase